MEEKLKQMKELSQRLRDASKAYYQDGRELMSNLEYDRLYARLEELEKETGITLAQSPTVSVGYEAVDELPKERHEVPMLSLDKTKDVEVLRAFIGKNRTMISWKLDGLTVVLTYRGGELTKALTRGNGEVGEVITNNARVFRNIPLRIAYQGDLVLRGEAVISYPDFEWINRETPDVDAKYKNPRNLCSGSVRQLNNAITAQRRVHFYAFSLVSAPGVEFHNSHELQMLWLNSQGFDTVEYRIADESTLDDAISYFSEKIRSYEIPSDGLVALYDDIAYGQGLGNTAKFPRNAFAFKWKDEIARTTLREVEWSASRTGLINPVAIFDPVELEGTTVSRASVHNVSMVRSMQLGIGDQIEVYKANMIIPQIAENLTRSGNLPIPDLCPVCGQTTKIMSEQGTETLQCVNPDCMAKRIKGLALFVSRDALHMDGLSEATLEKLVSAGLIHEYADLFRLEPYRDRIVQMEGFGEKSYRKLIDSIEAARHTTLARLLYGLGIPGIGSVGARTISQFLEEDPDRILTADRDDLAMIDGIGPVIADSFVSYFQNAQNRKRYLDLLEVLTLEKTSASADRSPEDLPLRGKVFVITGAVHAFANRSEMKQAIEERGGKVTGSVSSKTDYLVNNDLTSTSSKNRKAAELGVPVISEDQLIEMLA